jgi:hypothetical protein
MNEFKGIAKSLPGRLPLPALEYTRSINPPIIGNPPTGVGGLPEYQTLSIQNRRTTSRLLQTFPTHN